MGRRGWNLRGENSDRHHASGEQHYAWKGDAVADDSGRQRARALYAKLGACAECGEAAVERHHKDDDPRNNAPTNVVPLCRKCHMRIDGRLARLAAKNPPKQPAKDCTSCGRAYKPLRKGLCGACYQRIRVRGNRATT